MNEKNVAANKPIEFGLSNSPLYVALILSVGVFSTNDKSIINVLLVINDIATILNVKKLRKLGKQTINTRYGSITFMENNK